MIEDHIEVAEKQFPGSFYTGDFSRWCIEVTDLAIYGRTSMDNFNMYKFLKWIKVPKEAIMEWD